MESEIEDHSRDQADDDAQHLERDAAQVDYRNVGFRQITDELANYVGKISGRQGGTIHLFRVEEEAQTRISQAGPKP